MQGPLIKTPGTYDEIDIRCPRCSSHEITINLDPKGYYSVNKCNECDYKRGDKI